MQPVSPSRAAAPGPTADSAGAQDRKTRRPPGESALASIAQAPPQALQPSMVRRDIKAVPAHQRELERKIQIPDDPPEAQADGVDLMDRDLKAESPRQQWRERKPDVPDGSPEAQADEVDLPEPDTDGPRKRARGYWHELRAALRDPGMDPQSLVTLLTGLVTQAGGAAMLMTTFHEALDVIESAKDRPSDRTYLVIALMSECVPDGQLSRALLHAVMARIDTLAQAEVEDEDQHFRLCSLSFGLGVALARGEESSKSPHELIDAVQDKSPKWTADGLGTFMGRLALGLGRKDGLPQSDLELLGQIVCNPALAPGARGTAFAELGRTWMHKADDFLLGRYLRPLLDLLVNAIQGFQNSSEAIQHLSGGLVGALTTPEGRLPTSAQINFVVHKLATMPAKRLSVENRLDVLRGLQRGVSRLAAQTPEARFLVLDAVLAYAGALAPKDLSAAVEAIAEMLSEENRLDPPGIDLLVTHLLRQPLTADQLEEVFSGVLEVLDPNSRLDDWNRLATPVRQRALALPEERILAVAAALLATHPQGPKSEPEPPAA